MFTKCRILNSTLLFTFLAIVLVSMPALAGSKTQDLPEDILSILPSDIHFMVVAPSLKTINEAVEPFVHLMDLPDGESFDAQILLEEFMGDGAKLINPDKPLVMTLAAGNVMAGESPSTTLVVYLDVDHAKTDEMIASKIDSEGEVQPRLRVGNYVAFSSELGLIPGNGTSALLEDIPQGSLVACLDLEKIFGQFRPLIEMGLGMAAMSAGAATADTTAATPAMTAQEITSATKVLVALMDSALRFDMAFENDGDRLALSTFLKLIPDSPLSPGPQPDFNEALDITRMLPADAAYVMAQSWNFGPLADFYLEYYSASLGRLTAAMTPDAGAGFLAWYDNFADTIDLYELPMASSLNLTQDGLTANTIIKCDNVDQRMNDLTAIFNGLPEDLGYSFKALPEMKVGGVEVKSWALDYDTETMIKTMSSTNDPVTDETDLEQMAMANAMVEKYIPQFMMASHGEYLFISASKDTESLESMFKALKMRRGGIDKFTARVAKDGGDDCRQLHVIDAMALLTWATEMFEEIAQQSGELDEDSDFPTPDGPPIMLSSTTSAGTDGYSSSVRIKTNELAQLIEIITELSEIVEEMDDQEQETE